MMRIAKDEIIFGRYVSYEELVSKLVTVTVDDVIEVARDIFREDQTSLVILGPFKEEELDKGALQFRSDTN
jgi:predicted Zn-dependent peptidase